jgi:type IV pilus assembly protein PilM
MRIIGIDLGSTSVKAVELDSAFGGGFEIHEYHEHRIVPGQNPMDAVHALVAALPKAPDRVTIALRTSQVTFRNLQLPTKDKKAIQASIGFELEDDLPFPLEQTIYDYSVLSTAGQSSHVHVATTLKRYVENTLAQWGTAGVDPDLITTEAWAYRSLLNRVLGATAQEEPVLLAQLGHERSTLYIHWRGVPVVARELPWGGRELTAAICRKYGVPLEQAEGAKLDHGFVLPASQRANATAEQVEFSDTILTGLDELLREIRQIGLTCKNITHQNLKTIYLAGGTSLLPGLARLIEEELQVSTRPLQALSAIAAPAVTYSEQTDASFVLAVATALCLVGSERSLAINLRKGPLAKLGRSRDLSLAALRKPALALATILVCLFGSLFAEKRIYRSRLDDIDTRLRKSVKDFFGQPSDSALRNYLSNTPSLRASIKKELDKQREYARLTGPNPASPLGFLKELSTVVPKDTVVDMTLFQVGAAPASPYSPTAESSASLSFLVANPQMAEKLATLLGPRLKGMDRSKMDETSMPDGSKRWKVTFSGKPTEESYGK